MVNLHQLVPDQQQYPSRGLQPVPRPALIGYEGSILTAPGKLELKPQQRVAGYAQLRAIGPASSTCRCRCHIHVSGSSIAAPLTSRRRGHIHEVCSPATGCSIPERLFVVANTGAHRMGGRVAEWAEPGVVGRDFSNQPRTLRRLQPTRLLPCDLESRAQAGAITTPTWLDQQPPRDETGSCTGSVHTSNPATTTLDARDPEALFSMIEAEAGGQDRSAGGRGQVGSGRGSTRPRASAHSPTTIKRRKRRLHNRHGTILTSHTRLLLKLKYDEVLAGAPHHYTRPCVSPSRFVAPSPPPCPETHASASDVDMNAPGPCMLTFILVTAIVPPTFDPTRILSERPDAFASVRKAAATRPRRSVSQSRLRDPRDAVRTSNIFQHQAPPRAAPVIWNLATVIPEEQHGGSTSRALKRLPASFVKNEAE
uniref:Uncharacterized protein n=1 Tax=Mycena chlorophos TaxID=658473 RepID=A0ABQ0L411_MYCCL|nr:predicted protein [Mycena chlorophos]